VSGRVERPVAWAGARLGLLYVRNRPGAVTRDAERAVGKRPLNVGAQSDVGSSDLLDVV